MTRTADVADPWSQLEANCAAVLDLSRDLQSRIQAGAAAEELMPLLAREREAVDGVCERIAELADVAPAPATAERRDGIAAQLTELLRVDTVSRELLSRRGVRLKPPRWRRAPTRKGM